MPSTRQLSEPDRLPLRHSWPLCEQPKQFELGLVLNSAITDVLPPEQVGGITIPHVGCWECDLSDNSLIWSGGVYDIFGLPRGITITRNEAVGLYADHSRTTMESLRAHAIKHKRGFTLDVEINAAVGGRRWMRLIAAPVLDAGAAVKLRGLKVALWPGCS